MAATINLSRKYAYNIKNNANFYLFLAQLKAFIWHADAMDNTR